jgi:hypothetical protein
MNKTYLALAMAVGIVGGAAFTTYGIDHVSAQTNGSVQQSAQREGLTQEEAQERASERQEQRQERRTEHYDQLVEDGVITQEQSEALEAKHKEMDAKREELRGQIQKLHEEFEQWAELQGIDLQDIRREGHGIGMGGRHW